MANFYQTSQFSGLGTFTIMSAPATDAYTLQATLILPGIVQGSGSASSVVATVKQNGSTVYTSAASSKGLQVGLECSSGDSIQIVLSSSNPIDQAANAVQMTTVIWQGEARES